MGGWLQIVGGRIGEHVLHAVHTLRLVPKHLRLFLRGLLASKAWLAMLSSHCPPRGHLSALLQLPMPLAAELRAGRLGPRAIEERWRYRLTFLIAFV